MVCTVADARAVIAARDAAGKQLLVSYQRHYAGSWRYCRQQILSGTLGPLHFIQAYQCQNWWQPNHPSAQAWRKKPELSGGGQLNDSGSHLIDIILWASNLVPEEVFAYISNQGAQVDILSAICVRFRGGAIGNISVVGQSKRGFDEEVNLWGAEGCLQVLGTGRQRLIYHNPDAREIPPEERPDFGDPDTNFINAILGREEVQSPAECGLRVIALTEAIWKSAASGQPERCAEV
jgi:predicted dehydrogenase